VDDPGRVRARERVGDLPRELHGLDDRKPSTPDDLVERPSLDELHRDEVDAVRLVDLVDRDDSGVTQGAGGTGLPEEPPPPVRVADLLPRQDLQGHETFELLVEGPIHGPHPAFTELLDHPVMRERRPDHRTALPSARSFVCFRLGVRIRGGKHSSDRRRDIPLATFRLTRPLPFPHHPPTFSR
jgi:hypothetical protein